MKSSLMKLNRVSTYSGKGPLQIIREGGTITVRTAYSNVINTISDTVSMRMGGPHVSLRSMCGLGGRETT